MYTYYMLAGLLGLIVGSFLTALVARYGAKTIARGRSQCGSCGHALGVWDLVPFFSFIFLKGKCRYCQGPISFQYVVIEILTVVVFVSSAHHVLSITALSGGEMSILFLLYVIAWSALIALSFYDLAHYIIPDGLVSTFIVFGYGARLYELYAQHVAIGLLDIVSGFLLALPFLLLWLISRGTWLGFGDIKLALGMGGMLGIISGVSAVVLGVWIGAGLSLLLMVMPKSFALVRGRKQLTIKSEVPFGPYLALGTYMAFMWFPDVFNLSVFYEMFITHI